MNRTMIISGLLYGSIALAASEKQDDTLFSYWANDTWHVGAAEQHTRVHEDDKKEIYYVCDAQRPYYATPPNAKADIPPPNRPPEALLINVFATLPTVGNFRRSVDFDLLHFLNLINSDAAVEFCFLNQALLPHIVTGKQIGRAHV